MAVASLLRNGLLALVFYFSGRLVGGCVGRSDNDSELRPHEKLCFSSYSCEARRWCKTEVHYKKLSHNTIA